MQSSSLVKSSFFDENPLSTEEAVKNSPVSTPLWVENFNPTEFIQRYHNLSKELIHSDTLLRKSQKKQSVKERYFLLYKDRLECYEVIILF
jgi:hypothetical protein